MIPTRMRQLIGLSCLCVALSAVGCKQVNTLRGEGFEDESSKTLKQARPPDPSNKEKWGFSTKSRQIEDELGIR